MNHHGRDELGRGGLLEGLAGFKLSNSVVQGHVPPPPTLAPHPSLQLLFLVSAERTWRGPEDAADPS